jgi:hypothetical protein
VAKDHGRILTVHLIRAGQSPEGGIKSTGTGHQVRAWTTWRIDFLQGNNPITIPGAPTTINGPVTTRILPVAESQAIVVN